MNSKQTVISAVAVLSTLMGVFIPYGVEAANIVCNSANNPCSGTNNDDNMIGDAGNNRILGLKGNDDINGKDGNDVITGSDGNDKIDGGSGNDDIRGESLFFLIGIGPFCINTAGADTDDVIAGSDGNDEIQGCGGADRISGGSGDDQIIHGASLVTNSGDFRTSPDGSKDKIDCGPGNDEAWINTSVDHDVAVNCETVHAG